MRARTHRCIAKRTSCSNSAFQYRQKDCRKVARPADACGKLYRLSTFETVRSFDHPLILDRYGTYYTVSGTVTDSEHSEDTPSNFKKARMVVVKCHEMGISGIRCIRSPSNSFHYPGPSFGPEPLESVIPNSRFLANSKGGVTGISLIIHPTSTVPFVTVGCSVVIASSLSAHHHTLMSKP